MKKSKTPPRTSDIRSSLDILLYLNSMGVYARKMTCI
jgi:hypothetical protein